MADEQKAKHPGGRPPLYPATPESVEEMERRIEDYFTECSEGRQVEVVTKRGEVVKITRKLPPTVEGMFLRLGMASRNVLCEYEKKPEFKDTITRAKARIAESRITAALLGEVDANMARLDLSHNFAYKEASTLDIPGGMGLTINVIQRFGDKPPEIEDAQVIVPELPPIVDKPVDK